MTASTVPMQNAAATGLVNKFFARGLQWPLLIVVLLTIPVVAGGYLAYMATHDPTFALESDYYRKAVAWDATMAQDKANGELGWQSEARATPTANGLDVAISLRDKTAANLAGLKVHVDGFFLARGKDLQSGDAQLGADGRYHATLALPHGGIHEIRVRAEQGTAVFTATHRLDVAR